MLINFDIQQILGILNNTASRNVVAQYFCRPSLAIVHNFYQNTCVVKQKPNCMASVMTSDSNNYLLAAKWHVSLSSWCTYYILYIGAVIDISLSTVPVEALVAEYVKILPAHPTCLLKKTISQRYSWTFCMSYVLFPLIFRIGHGFFTCCLSFFIAVIFCLSLQGYAK